MVYYTSVGGAIIVVMALAAVYCVRRRRAVQANELERLPETNFITLQSQALTMSEKERAQVLYANHGKPVVESTSSAPSLQARVQLETRVSLPGAMEVDGGAVHMALPRRVVVHPAGMATLSSSLS